MEHEPLHVHIHQDERMLRSMVLMANTLAEQNETITLLGATMSALSDAVDALINRVTTIDTADKARIADLEQQLATAQAELADTPAQIDRINQIDAPPAE